MKIIGAGFGRTGTTSLQAALEELGFIKCYHMKEVFAHDGHADFWQRAAGGEEVDWQTFFANYAATVDWPGCTFYKELMEVYPDAKVLLNVREPDRWYESTHKTIYRVWRSPAIKVIQLFVPRLRRVQTMIHTLIWQGTFDGRFSDRAHAMAIFERHNREVQQYVPPERLLIYSVKEGWEPLCKFLDVPVPQEKAFPHLNDRALMQSALRVSNILLVGLSIAIVTLLVRLVHWGIHATTDTSR